MKNDNQRVYDEYFEGRKPKREVGYFTITFLISVFFVALILIFGAFYIVPAGERAVLVTLGKPSLEAKGEGFHFKAPLIQKAVKMDVKTQKYEADLTAASRDLQDVNTKVAINYKLVPEQVPYIYQQIGIDYSEKVIYPLEQETNKAVTSQYTAEELVTRREEVRQKMKDNLAEKLRERGIIVEEVSIIDFQFSASFTAAIENKVTAEQNALAAKNKLEQVKFEAEQRIEEARGKAEAINVESQALRENRDILELRAIEKWDGRMPLVVGSGTMPFINLGVNQSA